MNDYQQSGFSLVQVMIASGLLGMISLGVMHLSKNMNDMMANATATQDQFSLFNEIEMLLGNEADCRVSLSGEKGEPRLSFYKKNIDGNPQGEGLQVELSNATQNGEEIERKRFSAIEPDLIKYGNVIIKDIKLLMNNGSDDNYGPRDFHVDQGELAVEIKRRSGVKKHRTIEKRFPVQFTLTTDESGRTEIISCSNKSDAMAEKKACENSGRFYKPNQTPPCSLSLEKVNPLPVMGSTEGNMGVLRCPQGFGVTGVSGSSDPSNLRQLRVHCEPVKPNNLKPDHENPYGSAPLGKQGMQAGTSVCGEGKWASGVRASVNDGLSGVAVNCSDYNGGEKSSGRTLGSGAGVANAQECDEKTVLRELSVYYSEKIEGIRGVCW